MLASDTTTSQAWDPSLPGSGCQRVVGITQLYFRLGHHNSLTLIVVDALCLVFGMAGATLQDLSDYLALSVDRIEAAIHSIPSEMRCTSTDEELTATAFRDGDYQSQEVSSSAGGLKKEELRYYLNYKRILPVAYAHIARMLLALCTSPLPHNSSVDQSEKGGTATALLSRTTAPTFLGRAEALETAPPRVSSSPAAAPPPSMLLNLSAGIKRREALEGVHCRVCRFYFCLEEFNRTVTGCPMCGADVLRHIIEGLKARADLTCSRGRSLVTLPSAATQRTTNTTTTVVRGSTPSSPVGVSSPTSAISADREVAVLDVQGLNCPLARDPFLLQKALAFLYLYSSPFACLNESRCVINPDEILTEPEYERRVHGRTCVADQFRAFHRHPASVHVKLISQADADAKLRTANAQKVAKRTHLPPWLSEHTAIYAALSSRRPQSQVREVFQALKTGASGITPPQDKRLRDAAPQTAEERRRKLLRTAEFVSSEFLDEDFDEVPLPIHRSQCGERR